MSQIKTIKLYLDQLKRSNHKDDPFSQALVEIIEILTVEVEKMQKNINDIQKVIRKNEKEK